MPYKYLIDRVKNTKAYNSRPDVKARTKELSRKRYLANRDKFLRQSKDRYLKNREKNILYYRKWRAELEDKVFNAYGNRCSCCGETERKFLTIQHMNGDGKEHRKQVGGSNQVYYDLIQRGFPKDGYTLYCMNCNFADGRRGGCPHKDTTVAMGICC